MSTFAKELDPGGLAQEESSTTILKRLLHDENFGAVGVKASELKRETKLARRVFFPGLWRLRRAGHVEKLFRNKTVLYCLTDTGSRLAR